MGFSYNVSVLNQKGSPAIYTDTFANRPTFGYAGRLFIANDTSAIYEDTGTAWVLIANVSSGAGTLQQVTTNGNTSNVGISITAGGLSTNSLTDTALTLGSVLFSGASGLVSQDNPAFFWDDTNNRLGINTNTPGNSLDVHSAGTNPILALNNTAGNQSAISFLNTAVAKWRIGNTATNTLDIYNFTLAAIALQIKANNNAVFISSVQADEYTVQPTGYSILASLSRNLTGSGYGVLTLRNSANGTVQTAALTVDRTYTLPDATGTIALTSDLSSYLPLAGGTMTGTLNGTTITFGSNANNLLNSGNFQMVDPAGLKYLQVSVTSTLANIATNYSDSNIPLSLNSYGNTNQLYLSTGGKVLLGSNVDDTVNKLQVTGSIKVTGDSNLTGNITITKTTPAITMEGRNSGNSGTQLKFLGWNTANPNWQISVANFGNGLDLSVSTANGGSTFTAAIGSFDKTTGIYTAVSDLNKKKDFEDSLIGLNAILGLKPTLYRMFNEENTNKHLGFIAQEVKDFIPQAYVESGENENKFIGLNYQAITTTLVKAIQDQQIIIESLIKRIEILENK